MDPPNPFPSSQILSHRHRISTGRLPPESLPYPFPSAGAGVGSVGSSVGGGSGGGNGSGSTLLSGNAVGISYGTGSGHGYDQHQHGQTQQNGRTVVIGQHDHTNLDALESTISDPLPPTVPPHSHSLPNFGLKTAGGPSSTSIYPSTSASASASTTQQLAPPLPINHALTEPITAFYKLQFYPSDGNGDLMGVVGGGGGGAGGKGKGKGRGGKSCGNGGSFGAEGELSSLAGTPLGLEPSPSDPSSPQPQTDGFDFPLRGLSLSLGGGVGDGDEEADLDSRRSSPVIQGQPDSEGFAYYMQTLDVTIGRKVVKPAPPAPVVPVVVPVTAMVDEAEEKGRDVKPENRVVDVGASSAAMVKQENVPTSDGLSLEGIKLEPGPASKSSEADAGSMEVQPLQVQDRRSSVAVPIEEVADLEVDMEMDMDIDVDTPGAGPSTVLPTTEALPPAPIIKSELEPEADLVESPAPIISAESKIETVPMVEDTGEDERQVDVDLGALKSVSRLHARIGYSYTLSQFYLEVLGRNGAWVDDVFWIKGSRVALGPRTKIQISTRTFYFILPPSSVANYPIPMSSAAQAGAANRPTDPHAPPPPFLPEHPYPLNPVLQQPATFNAFSTSREEWIAERMGLFGAVGAKGRIARHRRKRRRRSGEGAQMHDGIPGSAHGNVHGEREYSSYCSSADSEDWDSSDYSGSDSDSGSSEEVSGSDEDSSDSDSGSGSSSLTPADSSSDEEEDDDDLESEDGQPARKAQVEVTKEPDKGMLPRIKLKVKLPAATGRPEQSEPPRKVEPAPIAPVPATKTIVVHPPPVKMTKQQRALKANAEKQAKAAARKELAEQKKVAKEQEKAGQPTQSTESSTAAVATSIPAPVPPIAKAGPATPTTGINGTPIEHPPLQMQPRGLVPKLEANDPSTHIPVSVPIPPTGKGPRPPPGPMLGLDGKAFIGPEPLKPDLTYATIIYRALANVDRGRGTLGQVCDWVAGEWEWFRLNPDAGWQNSIRHNLSLNKAFLKVPRIESDDPESKGSVWILDPIHAPEFAERERKIQEAKDMKVKKDSERVTTVKPKRTVDKGNSSSAGGSPTPPATPSLQTVQRQSSFTQPVGSPLPLQVTVRPTLASQPSTGTHAPAASGQTMPVRPLAHPPLVRPIAPAPHGNTLRPLAPAVAPTGTVVPPLQIPPRMPHPQHIHPPMVLPALRPPPRPQGSAASSPRPHPGAPGMVGVRPPPRPQSGMVPNAQRPLQSAAGVPIARNPAPGAPRPGVAVRPVARPSPASTAVSARPMQPQAGPKKVIVVDVDAKPAVRPPPPAKTGTARPPPVAKPTAASVVRPPLPRPAAAASAGGVSTAQAGVKHVPATAMKTAASAALTPVAQTKLPAPPRVSAAPSASVAEVKPAKPASVTPAPAPKAAPKPVVPKQEAAKPVIYQPPLQVANPRPAAAATPAVVTKAPSPVPTPATTSAPVPTSASPAPVKATPVAAPPAAITPTSATPAPASTPPATTATPAPPPTPAKTFPIVVKPIPAHLRKGSFDTHSQILDGPPLVVDEGTIILNPSIFSHLTAEHLKHLQSLGTQQTLQILQAYIVQHLREKMRQQGAKAAAAASGNKAAAAKATPKAKAPAKTAAAKAKAAVTGGPTAAIAKAATVSAANRPSAPAAGKMASPLQKPAVPVAANANRPAAVPSTHAYPPVNGNVAARPQPSAHLQSPSPSVSNARPASPAVQYAKPASPAISPALKPSSPAVPSAQARPASALAPATASTIRQTPSPALAPAKPAPAAPLSTDTLRVIAQLAAAAGSGATNLASLSPNAAALLQYLRQVGAAANMSVAAQILATGVIPPGSVPPPGAARPLANGSGAARPGGVSKVGGTAVVAGVARPVATTGTGVGSVLGKRALPDSGTNGHLGGAGTDAKRQKV